MGQSLLTESQRVCALKLASIPVETRFNRFKYKTWDKTETYLGAYLLEIAEELFEESFMFFN